MSGKNRKIVMIVAVAVAALVLGGAYIWYSGNYAGRNRVTLSQTARADNEWRNVASSNGIVGDYLWSRTTELMIKNSSDGVMIPSTYMIEGRLISEPAVSSEEYLLFDQALLLKNYVRRGDRFSAAALKDRVNEVLISEDQDDLSLCEWLDAYLEYYSSYGSKSDYNRIVEIAGMIFDSDGNMRQEQLSIASFIAGDYYSLADESGNTGVLSTIEQGNGEDPEESVERVTITGIRLAAIDLKLIRDLEDNGIIPEGTFDRYCEIAEGGRVSDGVPYYAYAFYYSSEGNIEYVSSFDVPAAVSTTESLLTLTHLTEVGRGDHDIYSNVKNLVINGMAYQDTYYIISRSMGGDEDLGVYAQIMQLALVSDDIDLYDRASARVGFRIATYSSSPALYMVYRAVDDRFVFDARENLTVSLSVN